MSDKKYRVWVMEHVTEADDYRNSITAVIGTPYGIQDVLVSEEELDLLRIGLMDMSSYSRPVIYYQSINDDANDIIKNVIQQGKLGKEKEEKRRAKLEETRKKKEATARKNKEKKERQEFEKLKKKFGET
jgi:hypothetical protein